MTTNAPRNYDKRPHPIPAPPPPPKNHKDVIEFIDNIRKNLNTQNDRMTSYPLFCVFEKKEIVVNDEYDWDYKVFVDKNDSENYVKCNKKNWQLEFYDLFNNDIEKCIKTLKDDDNWDDFEGLDLALDEDKISFVNFLSDNTCSSFIDDYGINEISVKEIDEFVTACFTEEGANNYLKINGHNLRKPFIYVTSLYRNEEMIKIRELLKD